MNKEFIEIVGLTKSYIQNLRKKGATGVFADNEPVFKKTVTSEKTCLKDNHSGNVLERFYDEIKNCQKCQLGKTRTKFVFSDGSTDAKLVFIGEAPGHDEDLQGKPFVGRAGQLLTKIIEAMGLKREDVYICNVLKCRPPNNRAPLPEEIEVCRPYLVKQLELLKNKKVICCLGVHAAKSALGLELPMKDMRGKWNSYEGTPVMVTYHPAYLLRNPADKKKVWEDMQKVMECLRK
jgi:DNA polymerase